MTRKVPKIDKDDMNGIELRQAAPEYAQSIYISSIKEEYAIGNYFNIKGKSSKIVTLQ